MVAGSTDRRAQLPRVLNRFDAIMIVVGSIIGSGIFLKEAEVTRLLNSFVLEVAVWTIVGLITLCASLALAELAAMLPHAGGPYVYLSHAYGRAPAFLWGWTEFWIIRSGSVGALACATAIYINRVFPNIDRTGQEIVAIAIVVVLAAINAIGTRWGAGVQNVTAVVKVSFLLILIIAPWLLLRAEPNNLQPLLPPDAMNVGLLQALGMAMIAVSWPYDGWISIAPIAEEIRKPQRNVPVALCVGMLIVIVVYVAAITSYHLVLPMPKVAQSSAVAADVCQVLFGDVGRIVAAIGVMFSTFGACNSNMLTGPRIYFSMARDGLLPRALRDVHSQFRTPANAILLQGFWAVLLILGVFYWTSGVDPSLTPTAAFDSLTNFVIFGGSLFYALAVGAVFILRRKYPTMERPYRTWGYPVTPIIYLVSFAAVLLSLLINKWFETSIGIGLIAAGAVYYVVATSREKRA